MSQTTFDLDPIVAGDPNAAATVDGNFDEIKNKLETTGLGRDNLKAIFIRHVIPVAKEITNNTVHRLLETYLPSGVNWTVEKVSAYCKSYAGDHFEVNLYIDGGAGFVLAGFVQVNAVATEFSFVPSPAVWQGGYGMRLVFDGATDGATTDVVDFSAVIYVRDALAES